MVLPTNRREGFQTDSRGISTIDYVKIRLRSEALDLAVLTFCDAADLERQHRLGYIVARESEKTIVEGT